VPQTFEDFPKEPRWPSTEASNDWPRSGKVGTRHLTLGLCLVTTRKAWTKLDFLMDAISGKVGSLESNNAAFQEFVTWAESARTPDSIRIVGLDV